MTNPLVSVIMPVYNSAKYVVAAIESVIAQTYANWELFIIDDYSSDNAVALIEQYVAKDNRIILLKLKQNGGSAVARNTGIEAANGKYIAFLDADDVWLPNKLAMQVPFMEKDNIALSCTWYAGMHPDGSLTGKIIKAPAHITYKHLLKNNTIGCLTAMYNVTVCGKQYMPLLRKRQDYGLWLNILKEHHKAKCLAEVLANYRVGMDSLSKNKFKVLQYNWEILRKHQQLSFFMSAYYFTCYLWNKTFKYLS